MEMKLTRKRGLSSPSKRSRTSLNFECLENTPPRKRKRIILDSDTESSKQSSPTEVESSAEENENPIAIKSFYGKREKKTFPHSPNRRKAVDQVLTKLLENASESLIKSTSFETKTSTPTEGKGKSTREAFRQSDTSSNKRKGSQRVKSPIPIQTIAKEISLCLTPEAMTKKSVSTPEDGNLSGKKFFKHKSPGNKYTDRVIVRKGFKLSFTTRRSLGSGGKGKKSSKSGAKKEAKTKKTKPSKPSEDGNNKRKKEADSVDNISVCHSGAASDSSLGNSHEILTDAYSDAESVMQPTSNSAILCTPQKVLLQTNSSMGAYNDSPSKNLRNRISSKTLQESRSYTGSDDLFSSQCNSEVTPTEGSGILGTPVSVRTSPESDVTSVAPSETETESSLRSGPSVRTQIEKKYFSIFSPQVTPKHQNKLKENIGKKNSPRSSPRLKFVENKKDQMTLDAGQKRFGTTQCDVCGMVYTLADPSDETTHSMFHQSLLNVLKFPGWKKERVVQEFPEDGSRVLMILDNDPKYAVKKVEEINKLMGEELGFPEPLLAFRTGYKAFLLISDEKRVMGCCVAEPVTEGYRVIPDSQPSQEPGHRPWCCKTEPEKASVGISRIWVNKQDRRKGVATKLLDCVRKWFQYGSFIHRSRIAFSDPTPDGKQLATKYTRSNSFLVYKYG